MKKYIKKDNYGYVKNIFHNKDVTSYYFISTLIYGYYYYWKGLNKIICNKGYFNMNIKYSHWVHNYETYKYWL